MIILIISYKFNKYNEGITGLEGLQVIQVAFPNEITFIGNTNAKFIPLLETSMVSFVSFVEK